jgi:nicotinate-nucleotide adenylyltransferase
MADKVKRLALFGGSFSPPHFGHTEAALAFMNAIKADKLLIMPAREHPCKGGYSEGAEHRYEMCRLAFENDTRFSGKCRVSRLELDSEEVSYTYLTLRRLKEEAEEIYMLVGADVLAGMENWKNSREIFENAVICYIGRGESGREAAENYRTKYGARITELDACVPSVSSNEIRRAAKAGEALEGLCAEVADYIITHALYGAEDDR